jgi:hypothetical protein
MPKAQLFELPQIKVEMGRASEKLLSRPSGTIPNLLGQTLKLIALHALDFDKYSQLNIGWIGDNVLGELKEVSVTADVNDDDDIYTLAATIYRFVQEYDLSVANELSKQFRSFTKAVREKIEDFPELARAEISFANHRLPIAIVKEIVNSNEFGNMRDVAEYVKSVDKTIGDWDEKLKKSEATTTRLATSLEQHTREFNFVGLREGFADLARTIENEQGGARRLMVIFGVLALMPSIADLWFVVVSKVNLAALGLHSLTLMGLGTVSITILLLYYFRIALRKADSCNVQLTQLRLRMSLCRFIQNYADYATQIKSKNPEALAKFESLIFAGIVSSEDKLPSTFDGMDQLAALAKSFSGGGK